MHAASQQWEPTANVETEDEAKQIHFYLWIVYVCFLQGAYIPFKMIISESLI